MFIGCIEDSNDPRKLGRYRVRVFGIHTDNKGELRTEDLPWAVTMQPTTSAAMNGIGKTPRLLKGTWVVVSFLDAEFQKPIVFGSIAGIPGDSPVGEMDVATEVESNIPPKTAPENVVQMPDGSVVPPKEVTNLPQGSKIIEQAYIGSLTKSQVNSLKNEIAKHESGGKSNPYAAQNSIGFIGKYQFGSDYLKDMGYINQSATGSVKSIIDNPSNWTGKGNITSKEIFFQKIDVQESLMEEMLKRNYSIMNRAGVVSSETMPEKLAGLLCAAHLKGAGGAIKFAKGEDSSDAFGTTCSKYYNYGYSSITGTSTVETPKIENLDKPAADKNSNNQYNDARKYDTGATKPRTSFSQGFCDPSGKYPLKSHLNESDLHRLAKGSKVSVSIVGEKEADIVKSVPVANGSITWKQSPIPYNARYPYNQVWASEAGHIMEFDDTEGCERVNIHHKSGTFTEVDNEGNQVNRVKGIRTVIVDEDDLVYIKGSGHVCIDGDLSLRVAKAVQIEVLGNANIKVHGDMNQEVLGNYSLNVRGSYNVNVAGSAKLASNTFNLTATNWFKITDIDETYIVGDVVTGSATVSSLSSYSPTIRIPSPVTRKESIEMVLEDNQELASRMYSDVPPPIKKEEDNKKPLEVIPVSGICGFTEISPELELSVNYRLSDLCKDGDFSYNGQHGKSAEELACNLKQLTINVIEPLRAKYSHLGFKINSGFRPAGSAISKAASGHISQHELGQAVDISFSKVRGQPNDREEFYKLAKEIRDTVPFDQLILEYRGKNSVWIHISFTSGSLRREVKTVNNDVTYSQGLTLLA